MVVAAFGHRKTNSREPSTITRRPSAFAAEPLRREPSEFRWRRVIRPHGLRKSLGFRLLAAVAAVVAPGCRNRRAKVAIDSGDQRVSESQLEPDSRSNLSTVGAQRYRVRGVDIARGTPPSARCGVAERQMGRV